MPDSVQQKSTAKKATSRGKAKTASPTSAKKMSASQKAEKQNKAATASRKTTTAKGEAPTATVVDETAHSVKVNTPKQPINPGEVLGQVSWLMMHSPGHKHMFLTDLEWLVMPALLLKQFRVFRKDGGPIAFASWAFLDEGASARMAKGDVKLSPAEWKSGDQAWLIDLVAPFGGHEEVLNSLKEQVFADQSLKSLQASPDGKGLAVLEW